MPIAQTYTIFPTTDSNNTPIHALLLLHPPNTIKPLIQIKPLIIQPQHLPSTPTLTTIFLPRKLCFRPRYQIFLLVPGPFRGRHAGGLTERALVVEAVAKTESQRGPAEDIESGGGGHGVFAYMCVGSCVSGCGCG